jgi:hypothetical protein
VGQSITDPFIKHNKHNCWPFFILPLIYQSFKMSFTSEQCRMKIQFQMQVLVLVCPLSTALVFVSSYLQFLSWRCVRSVISRTVTCWERTAILLLFDNLDGRSVVNVWQGTSYIIWLNWQDRTQIMKIVDSSKWFYFNCEIMIPWQMTHAVIVIILRNLWTVTVKHNVMVKCFITSNSYPRHRP